VGEDVAVVDELAGELGEALADYDLLKLHRHTLAAAAA
jgi:hypothetical protein